MKKIKSVYPCSLNLTHDLIGGKWKSQILWHIMEGDCRFSLLEKAIPDISHKVLSSQLKDLEESGLIIKEIVDNNPPKIVLYHLNPSYPNLEIMIQSLCDFSTHYAKKNAIIIGKVSDN